MTEQLYRFSCKVRSQGSSEWVPLSETLRHQDIPWDTKDMGPLIVNRFRPAHDEWVVADMSLVLITSPEPKEG